eukprot:360262-Chlamydomonas_euryale.AAC.1
MHAAAAVAGAVAPGHVHGVDDHARVYAARHATKRHCVLVHHRRHAATKHRQVGQLHREAAAAGASTHNLHVVRVHRRHGLQLLQLLRAVLPRQRLPHAVAAAAALGLRAPRHAARQQRRDRRVLACLGARWRGAARVVAHCLLAAARWALQQVHAAAAVEPAAGDAQAAALNAKPAALHSTKPATLHAQAAAVHTEAAAVHAQAAAMHAHARGRLQRLQLLQRVLQRGGVERALTACGQGASAATNTASRVMHRQGCAWVG